MKNRNLEVIDQPFRIKTFLQFNFVILYTSINKKRKERKKYINSNIVHT